MGGLKTNKKKARVLVFPCGSEIGLELHSALQWSTHVELFGASSVKSNHGKFVYRNYLELPFIDSQDFLTKLNAEINNHSIDFIFPAHDSAVLQLAEMRNEISCTVIGSPVETCRICRSKRKTYHIFEKILSIPKIYEKSDDVKQFPIFLKPDIGQGSRGTHIANTRSELEFLRKRDPSLILVEYLPGDEYTIDCFTDRYGNLLFIGARKRDRIQNGISVGAVPANDKGFRQMADVINGTIKLRGAWFFQVKEKVSGELALLEIAPRIAGSSGFHRNLGINLPLLSLFDHMGIDVETCANNFFLEMDRALFSRFKTDHAFKSVYIDLDDTVIFDNEVNIWAVAFLYQCRNKEIRVHLLSRHNGTISETLDKYQLAGLFDSVTHVRVGSEKADFITEPASIFIDDSFSERLKVAKKLGIPVFDVSDIESLIDWRK